ncbi:hypothetical protein BYT27DRAFT_6909364 [Phlegmacium glaucopus]|nr:hypothetical protein BYT27DRAFT_6909364 [Phlegmacium glaucopus]
MLNPLKFLRYFVFAIFVICNAIITSVAVWNLSIVELIADNVVAKEISSYLIFLGALGLVVNFTVLFFDLYGKHVFLCKVWFELLWVGLFLIMEFAGAAAITAQSNGQTCSSDTSISPCASTQVLQAFTWICAILLLGYLILLFVAALVKHRDDSTIWHCTVRNFPWVTSHHVHHRKSIPASSASLPRFRTEVPFIAAPRPRRIVPVPEALLSYRSGLSLDYEIEHYQPPALSATDRRLSTYRPTSLSPSTSPVAATVSPTRIRLQPQQTPPPKPVHTVSTPFYPTHVQIAINSDLQRPPIAHLSQARGLPLSPSPPPLGDWPRRDATSQPTRVKRKPVTPIPYTFTMPAAVQQRQPLSTSTTRSRPSGPRQRSNSGENNRPPNFDLSNFNSSHTRGYT